ncbi:hypothetical protein ACHAPQ_012283, partial [Fusarium lateritium]
MCPGITTSQPESWLPEGASVLRIMPHTPVAVKQWSTAIFANKAVTSQQATVVVHLFRSVSPQVTFVSQESGIDFAASISGSSPAYLFKLLSALVEAGVSHGLQRDTAAALVKQSGLGAAIQAIQDEGSLQSLIDDVCVPGSSTEKAMARLEDAACSAVMTAA